MRASATGEVLGPAPAPVPRVNDEWRYRIAVKTPDSAPVRAVIRGEIQRVARADRSDAPDRQRRPLKNKAAVPAAANVARR